MNDAIAGALEEMGLPWSRREKELVVPASARVPCEVEMAERGGEVVVRATLVAWDEIGEAEASALAGFLRRAEPCLHHVSLRVEEKAAIAEARVGEGEMEAAVGAVLAAARALSRESALLLQPQVTRAFETFQQNGSEIVASG